MKTISHIAVALHVLSIVGSTLMVPLIYLDFELRREYIAEVLCIKKDEPMTVCGGKCYLAKQLNKVNDQQKPKQQQTQRIEQLSLYSQAHHSHDYTRGFSLLHEKHLFPPNHDLPSSYIKEVFHPPQLG